MKTGLEVPSDQQNAQENKGTYIPLSTVVFIATVESGMSYPASLRTCGRYEFLF